MSRKAVSMVISLYTACCLFAIAVRSQEVGPIGTLKTYGTSGKLFSIMNANGLKRESYLLSSKAFQGDDSRGFEGETRVVLNYAGGGYEVQSLMYWVSCVNAAEENFVEFKTSDSDADGQMITVGGRDHPAKASEKEAFNLSWALCKNEFLKFK